MTDERRSPEWLSDVRRKLAGDNIERAFNASISLLRWVLTSTALFHSSALIAAFNSDRFAQIMFRGPAWFFIAGMALTVASGITLAFGAADLAGKMSDALWLGKDLNGDTHGSYDPEASKAIICGAAFLGLSVAALVLGVMFSGMQIAQMPVMDHGKVVQQK